MPTPRHTIVCTKKELVAPGVYELRFMKPAELHFQAGQFLLFDVPHLENPADIQPRAYSIASAPNESELLFCIKLKEGGRASTWIVESLDIGTSVSAVGPLGLFTVRDNEHELFFVATGAGLAPFRSQIKHALESGDTRPMHLVFGVRNPEDFFWVHELKSLAEKYQNFSLHCTLSGESAEWNGMKGRVQTVLPRIITKSDASSVYICGAPEMVSDVKKYCIESLGLPKGQVHAEGYI
ncbi:MAG: FAD-binding oxidoreductase [Candidatus Peribacteraceae bacterium]